MKYLLLTMMYMIVALIMTLSLVGYARADSYDRDLINSARPLIYNPYIPYQQQWDERERQEAMREQIELQREQLEIDRERNAREIQQQQREQFNRNIFNWNR